MGEARRRKLNDPNYGKISKAILVGTKKQESVVLGDKVYNRLENRLEQVPIKFRDNYIECIASFAEFSNQAIERVQTSLQENTSERDRGVKHLNKFIQKMTNEYEIYLRDYSDLEKEYLIVGFAGREWADAYNLIEEMETKKRLGAVKFIEEKIGTLFRAWLHHQIFKPYLPQDYLIYDSFWQVVEPYLLPYLEES